MDNVSLSTQRDTEAISLGLLPTWWDGESLYGWCTRFHALKDFNTRTLGTLLFGRPHAGRAVDIPSGLDRFHAATDGLLGTVETILTQRTVVAAYWPFADGHTRAKALAAVTDSLGTSAAQMLGLPASKMGTHHPLRSCPQCRRDQQAERGYATWLLRHQLPGVWWCPVHQQPLEQVPNERAVWRKPGSDEVPLGAPINNDERHALELAEALATSLLEVERADHACLQRTCLRRLRDLGLACSAVRLNVARLNAWLEDRPLVRWVRRQGKSIRLPAGNWVVPMLRGRSRQHPLKWVILWASLWHSDSVDIAIANFKQAASGRPPIGVGDQLLLWPDKWGRQVDAAAPRAIEEAFKSNQTIRGVATALGVSVGTVQAWMSERPDFTQAWHKGIHMQRLQAAKARMLHTMEVHPEITRSELLLRCKADSAWLGANAPRTLRRLLHRIPARHDAQGRLF